MIFTAFSWVARYRPTTQLADWGKAKPWKAEFGWRRRGNGLYECLTFRLRDLYGHSDPIELAGGTPIANRNARSVVLHADFSVSEVDRDFRTRKGSERGNHENSLVQERSRCNLFVDAGPEFFSGTLSRPIGDRNDHPDESGEIARAG